jgi:hypothetical protein
VRWRPRVFPIARAFGRTLAEAVRGSSRLHQHPNSTTTSNVNVLNQRPTMLEDTRGMIKYIAQLSSYILYGQYRWGFSFTDIFAIQPIRDQRCEELDSIQVAPPTQTQERHGTNRKPKARSGRKRPQTWTPTQYPIPWRTCWLPPAAQICDERPRPTKGMSP